MRDYKYTSAKEFDGKPATGYIIISGYLFKVNRNQVHDSWELECSDINEQIREAREVAGLTSNKKIYVDDTGIFDLPSILYEERLMTKYGPYCDGNDFYGSPVDSLFY